MPSTDLDMKDFLTSKIDSICAHIYVHIHASVHRMHTCVYTYTHKAYSLFCLKGASDRLVWGGKGTGREHTDRKPFRYSSRTPKDTFPGLHDSYSKCCVSFHPEKKSEFVDLSYKSLD